MQLDKNICVEAHISDIHFGVFDPAKQYEILKKQFINKISILKNLSLISINGDLFHHKYMANSDAVFYAMKFVDDLVNLSRELHCTLFIIHGTPSHDAGQTKLFYQYMEDKTVDVRVIETVRFEYVGNKKILCIPEVPGLDKEAYDELLLYNTYDSVCMHGTFRGAIYGRDKTDFTSPSPVFGMENFINSRGPIISGHVHIPGCYEKDFYYCGSPYRWCFGEEQPKGFLILMQNLKTRKYFVHFEEIKSFRYDTINMDELIKQDPSIVIKHIEDLRNSGIDNLRLEFNYDNKNIELLKNFFRNNPNVVLKCDFRNDIIKRQSQETIERFKEYNYITDKNLSPQEILTKYINQQKGYTYITTEELLDILKDD